MQLSMTTSAESLRHPRKQISPVRPAAFQDEIPDNHCYGCGPINAHGLKIKSHWVGGDESVCRFQPEPHHCAGPSKYVNGGIIATVIDCHCICTAFAYAYKTADREAGEGGAPTFATGTLSIKYLRPTPIDGEIVVHAKVVEATERKILLACSLSSDDEECATANVLAVAVPADW